MFLVRPATSSDLADLIRLEAAASESLKAFRGLDVLRQLSPLVKEHWNVIIASSHHHVLVGERDGLLLGYCLLEIVKEQSKCVVRQVFVSPEARELGLGAQLLSACENTARAGNCTSLEGFALPGDRETKNLFERFSMSAQTLIVGKLLN